MSTIQWVNEVFVVYGIWGYIGFIFAQYSVVGNDAIQTLGTFINSNKDKVSWKILWAGASAVLVVTLVYGWYVYGGDLSFGRLSKIPYVTPQWYHAAAPVLLLVLTRMGVPVSTSFLVLSVFSSSLILEKMLMKSLVGYLLPFVCSILIWYLLSYLVKFVNLKHLPRHIERRWRLGQAVSTGLLWSVWITHDMANITVFLPRVVPFWMLLLIICSFVFILAHIFKSGGGPIQRIVRTKINTRFIISATIIDLVYAIFLFVFKEYSDIPMSTTWVFVGLLSGREVGIRLTSKKKRLRKLLPMLVTELMKISFGALLSVFLVMLVQEKIGYFVSLFFSLMHNQIYLISTLLIGVLVLGLIFWAFNIHYKESDDHEDDHEVI